MLCFKDPDKTDVTKRLNDEVYELSEEYNMESSW